MTSPRPHRNRSRRRSPSRAPGGRALRASGARRSEQSAAVRLDEAESSTPRAFAPTSQETTCTFIRKAHVGLPAPLALHRVVIAQNSRSAAMTSLAMRAVAPARSRARARLAIEPRRRRPQGLGTAVADRRAPLLDRRDRPGAAHRADGRRPESRGGFRRALHRGRGRGGRGRVREQTGDLGHARGRHGRRGGFVRVGGDFERVADGRLRDVVAVPADALAAKEAAVAGFPWPPSS